MFFTVDDFDISNILRSSDTLSRYPRIRRSHLGKFPLRVHPGKVAKHQRPTSATSKSGDLFKNIHGPYVVNNGNPSVLLLLRQPGHSLFQKTVCNSRTVGIFSTANRGYELSQPDRLYDTSSLWVCLQDVVKALDLHEVSVTWSLQYHMSSP